MAAKIIAMFAAMIFARFAAPCRKRRDIAAADMLFWAWLFYLSAWSPFRLHHLFLIATGNPIDPACIWAAADTICASIMAEAFYRTRNWREMALAVSFVVQTFFHVGHAFGWDFGSYSRALDAVWFLQLGVVASNGTGRLCHRLHDRMRLYLYDKRSHILSRKSISTHGRGAGYTGGDDGRDLDIIPNEPRR